MKRVFTSSISMPLLHRLAGRTVSRSTPRPLVNVFQQRFASNSKNNKVTESTGLNNDTSSFTDDSTGSSFPPSSFDSTEFEAPFDPFSMTSIEPSALLSTAAEALLAAPTSYMDKPTYLVMQAIDSLHTAIGVPYWESIVLITLAVRIALIPMSILQLKTTATLGKIKPEIDKLQAEMLADPDKSIETRVKYETRVKSLFKEHDFKPMRMWLPFMQLPIFVGFFVGIKEMGDYFPAFKSGGIMWFTDLSAADPTYILPVVNAVTMLAMFEIGMANSTQQNPQQALIMQWTMRAASLAMVPLMISMPNGLFIHWAANNIFTIGQSALLAREDVKKYFGIVSIPPAAVQTDPKQTQRIVATDFVKLFQENAQKRQMAALQEHLKREETKKAELEKKARKDGDSGSK